MSFLWSESTTPAKTFNDVQWVSFLSLWVAVGDAGAVATSPDGVVWTSRIAASADAWRAVTSNGSIVVSVSSNGTVQTSANGILWTSRTAAEANAWRSVCWAAGLSLFVAVANSGVHRVMTSPDGVTWSPQTAAAALQWRGVCWSQALTRLVAVASDIGTGSVMTSSDAITWTQQTTASLTPTFLPSGSSVVAWSPGLELFAFAAQIAAAPKMMTSPDGATWTARTIPDTEPGLSVLDAPATGGFLGTRFGNIDFPIMVSADGITWTIEDPGTFHVLWESCGWSEDLKQFIATEDNGIHSVFLLGEWQGATVTGMSPARGTKRGGTVCTITGTLLDTISDVTFDGVAATDVVPAADGLTLTCLSPAHAVGAVDVEVVDADTLADAYTYVSVDRVSPDTGSVFGGTAVTITGYGFDLATGVLFDGVTATSIVYVSATTITAVTPLHASGSVTVTVVGVDFLADAYTYALSAVLLPPIPYNSPIEDPVTKKINNAWFLWLTTAKQRIETIPGALQISAEQIVGVFNEDQIPELPWDRIDKTGSSLADLAVPGAGADGSYLSTQGGVPVWRPVAGGAPIPRDFDPGSFTIDDDQWAAFPDYMVLGPAEVITMEAGAVLRIF